MAGLPTQTSRPDDELPDLPAALSKPVKVKARPTANPYDPFIVESAARHKMDPDFIRSVMGQESSNKPGATSNKGASGLMQLMPATAKRFGVKNIYDPQQNIEGGTQYLRWLLDRYNGDQAKALAGYNAGEGAVDKFGGIPPYRETEGYVSAISSNYAKTLPDIPKVDDLPDIPEDLGAAPALREAPRTASTKDISDEYVDYLQQVQGNNPVNFEEFKASKAPKAKKDVSDRVDKIHDSDKNEYTLAPDQTGVDRGYRYTRPVDGKPVNFIVDGNSIEREAPDWIKGKTAPGTILPRELKPEYDRALQQFGAADSEEFRKKFLSGFTEEDTQHVKSVFVPRESKATVGQRPGRKQPASPVSSPSAPQSEPASEPGDRKLDVTATYSNPNPTQRVDIQRSEWLESNQEERPTKRRYAKRPEFAQVFRDDMAQNYGPNWQDAHVAYMELTEKNLIAYNDTAADWYDKAPDHYYDAKTGQLKNVTTPYSPNIKRLVDAFNTGGKDAMREMLLKETPGALTDSSSRMATEENTRNEKANAIGEAEMREQLKDPSTSETIEKGLTAGLKRGGQVLGESIIGGPFLTVYRDISDFKNRVEMGLGSDDESINKQISDIREQYAASDRPFEDYRADRQKYAEMSAPETASRMAAEFGRGLVKTAVSDTLKGVDFVDALLEDNNPLAKLIPQKVRPGLRNLGNLLAYTVAYVQDPEKARKLKFAQAGGPVEERLFYNIGRAIDESLGDDKLLRGRFTGQFAQAMGSSAGFLLMGLVAPEASIETRLGEFSISSAGLGAVTQAGSGYQEGKGAGFDENKARAYGVVQGFLGATEGFGLGASLNRAIKTASLRREFVTSFLDWAKRTGKNALKGGAEEGIQEFIQDTGGAIALEAMKDKDPSSYKRVMNILDRLPKQAANVLVNQVPVAALSGGLVEGGMNIAAHAEQGGPRVDLKNNVLQLEDGKRYSFSDETRPVIQEWMSQSNSLDDLRSRMDKLETRARSAKGFTAKKAILKEIYDLQAEAVVGAGLEQRFMERISSDLTPVAGKTKNKDLSITPEDNIPDGNIPGGIETADEANLYQPAGQYSPPENDEVAQFFHKQEGIVQAVDDQKGVPSGKIRVAVVDGPNKGKQLVIQRPDGNGRGNNYATPIRVQGLSFQKTGESDQESADSVQDEAETAQKPGETTAEGAPAEFRTGSALWKNAESDQPVDVTGYAGSDDAGRHYVNIEGSSTGVPLDELEYPPAPKVYVRPGRIVDVAGKGKGRVAEVRKNSLIVDYNPKTVDGGIVYQSRAFFKPDQVTVGGFPVTVKEAKEKAAPKVAPEAPKITGTAEATDESLKAAQPRISLGDATLTANPDTEPKHVQKLTTQAGTTVDVSPIVVDESDIITSFKPGFPKELQPRKQDRDASTLRIERYKNELDPARMGDNFDPGLGRPILVAAEVDGEQKYFSITANHRLGAIGRIYEADLPTREAYEAFVREQMEREDVGTADPNVKRPVYAAVINDPAAVDLVKFAEEANEGTSQMGAAEQAVVDARKLNLAFLDLFSPDEEGFFNNAANADFIRKFNQHVVPELQQGSFLTSDGRLSQDGVNRVRNAVFAKAFGGSEEGVTAVSKLAEDPSNNTRNITNGLVRAVGGLAQLKALAEEDPRFAHLDITDDIAKAVAKYAHLRHIGKPVERYLEEVSLPGIPGPSVFQRRILQVLEEFKRSQTNIAGVFHNYVAAVDAIGNPDQLDMFGEPPDPTQYTQQDTFRAAVEAVEEGTYAKIEQIHLLEPDPGREVQYEPRQPAKGRSTKTIGPRPTDGKLAGPADSAGDGTAETAGDDRSATQELTDSEQATDNPLQTGPANDETLGTGSQKGDSTVENNAAAPTLSTSGTLAAHDAATSPQNDLAEPSQEQKEAGNYQKGHILINGLDISIENPVGSKRTGIDRDGKKWSITMKHHYGYIKRTIGADEEHIDLFVKDHTPADYDGPVFVVDQVHPDTGEFDEHKVMLGFATEEEARTAYASNYAKDWKGLAAITEMPFEGFKDWTREEKQDEPVAEIRDMGKKAEKLPTSAESVKETPENEQYGQTNTVFTEDAKEKALKLLREKLGGTQHNVGIDPEIVQAGLTVAGYHVEAGARTFAAFAEKMIGDLGDAVRPYLKSWYMAIKFNPGLDTQGMDDEAAVDAAIASFASSDEGTEKAISHLDTPEKQAANYRAYLEALREEGRDLDPRDTLTAAEKKAMLKRADDAKLKVEAMAGMTDEEIADLAKRDEAFFAGDAVPASETEPTKEDKRKAALAAEIERQIEGEPLQSETEAEPEPETETPPAAETDLHKPAPPAPSASSMLFDLGGLDEEGLFAQGGPTTIKPAAKPDTTTADAKEQLRAQALERELQKNREIFGKDMGDTLTAIKYAENTPESREAARAVLDRRGDLESQADLDLAGDATTAIAFAHESELRGMPLDDFIRHSSIERDDLGGDSLELYHAIDNGTFRDHFNNFLDEQQMQGPPERGNESPEDEAEPPQAAITLEDALDAYPFGNPVTDTKQGIKTGDFFISNGELLYFEGLRPDELGANNIVVTVEFSPTEAYPSERLFRSPENFTDETGFRAIIPEGATDVEHSGTDLEQGGKGGAQDVVRETVPTIGPRPNDRGISARGGTAEESEGRPAGDNGVSEPGTASRGEGSDPDGRGQESGDQASNAGDLVDGRSGPDSDQGLSAEYEPSEAVRTAAEQSERDLKSKAELQAAAESIDIRPGDLDNIRETLPFLFPEQQEDVHFAEKRHANAAGVLFTNSTGTGKTYTGLGVAKRAERQGKDNILIIAPTDAILNAWEGAAPNLHLHIKRLADTTDNGGSGIVSTTFANFRQNAELIKRDWDHILIDEGHYLSQNEAGDATGSMAMLRAAGLHPRGASYYHQIKNADMIMELTDLTAQAAVLERRGQSLSAADRTKLDRLRQKQFALSDRVTQAREAAYAEFHRRREENGTSKVTFLSATPFAYQKNISYAEGYLFDWGPEPESRGYNTPSAKQAFFIQHFGYRMRYNKLTVPDADVNSEVMEQQFNEWLKKQGAVSGRRLNIDKDYSRQFVLVDSAIGNKIDEGFDHLWQAKETVEGRELPKYGELRDYLARRFNYLSKRYTLEAINARSSIDIVRKHLALGRKVVVFHDYNKNEAVHPFKLDVDLDALAVATSERDPDARGKLQQQYVDFAAERPDLIDLDLSDLISPIERYTREFGDILGLFNGTIDKKQRQKTADDFNADRGTTMVLLAQSDAAREGISLHDTTGKHQRALLNLGLPVRPIAAIQIEGRTYRVGNASDAINVYLSTGTSFERYAFGTKISERASTAENLALGTEARALRQAFIDGYENAVSNYEPHAGEGVGGKEADKAMYAAISEYEKAKTYYFGQQKKTGKTKSAEGTDYYATPEPIGLKMAEWADQQLGESTLEPSAGHGAIARFLRVDNRKTLIEPSTELASRLSLVTDGNIRQIQFEDLPTGANKFDTILMNPPFGKGGSTAIAHLEKAVRHLNDRGRIVALIPAGPAADKRLAAFLASDAAKDVHQVGDIHLPAVAFKRAAAAVFTHIIVLDKFVGDPSLRTTYDETHDYSELSDINDLFDAMEDVDFQPRDLHSLNPAYDEAHDQQRDVAEGDSNFELLQFDHTKTNEPIFVAKMKEFVDNFKDVLAAAKAQGGYYSKYKQGGAIPGFHFKTPEARARFIADIEGDDSLMAIYAWHGSPHKYDKVDLSKSGSGQGNAMQGHGYYAADKEGVADYHRRFGVHPHTKVYLNNHNVTTWLWGDIGLATGLPAHLTEQIAKLGRNGYSKAIKPSKKLVDLVAGYGHALTVEHPDVPKGYRYRVELAPEEDEFLHWDKPLDQQSEKVKAALSKIPEHIFEEMAEAFPFDNPPESHLDPDYTGGEFYKALSSIERRTSALAEILAEEDQDWNYPQQFDKVVSDYLYSLGVRGNKYLDGPSRPTDLTEKRLWTTYEHNNGDIDATLDRLMASVYASDKEKASMRAHFKERLEKGYTHNYVIFNDEDVAIVDMFSIAEENARRQAVKLLKTVPLIDLPLTMLFSRTGSRVKINLTAMEVFRRALEQVDINAGKRTFGSEELMPSFLGYFADPGRLRKGIDVLKKAAEAAKTDGHVASSQKLELLASTIDDAGKAGAGTAVFYVEDSKLPQEIFHQASYLGQMGAALTKRHARPGGLDVHPAMALAADFFSRQHEYQRLPIATFKAVVREELAAWIAEGDPESLREIGLEGKEDLANEYLLDFFESYADKVYSDAKREGKSEEEATAAVNDALTRFEEVDYAKDAIESTLRATRIDTSVAEESARTGRGDAGNTQTADEGGSPGGTQGPAETPKFDLDDKVGIRKRVKGDASELGVKGKKELARLPGTMRAAGIAADDVLKTVFDDRSAQIQAKKLIEENGIEGTIRLLEQTENPDVHHAVASFAIQRMLYDEALRIELTNPDQAARLKEIGKQMAANMAMRMVRSGRFIRAAGVIMKTVPGVLATAERIYQEKHGNGQQLPADVVSRIEAKARAGETSLAENESLAKQVEALTREINKLKKSLSGDANFRKASKHVLANRKKLVTQVKSRHQHSVEAAMQRLRSQALIRATFGLPKDLEDLSLMSVYDDAKLDPKLLEDFATVGADFLLEGLAAPDMMRPAEFDEQMIAMFGDGIVPHLEAVHRESLRLRNEWLADLSKEQQIQSIIKEFGEDLSDDEVEAILLEREDELKRRQIIMRLHTIRAERGQPAKGISGIEAVIARLGGDTAAAIAASELVHSKPSAHELYRTLESLGIKDADARDALRKGTELLERARLIYKKEKAEEEAEIRRRLSESETDLAELDKLRLEAQTRARQSQREIAKELQRISTGEIRYYAGIGVELLNTPRAIMASSDASFMFRQGGWFMIARPKQQAAAFRAMYEALGGRISDVGYEKVMEEMQKNPMYDLSVMAGMDYAGLGKHGEHSITKGEEEFRNNIFGMIVDATKKEGRETLHAANVFRIPNAIIRKSDETYTAFLDAQRMSTFAQSAEYLQSIGLTFETHPREFRALAEYINDATGRSSVGSAKIANLLMNLPLFAPRFTVSRFKLLYKSTVGLPFLPPHTRSIVMRDAAGFYGAVGAVSVLAYLAGLGITLDWDDDDFLKIKVGKHHYDLPGGMQQPLRAMLRATTATGRRVLGEKYSLGLFRDSVYAENDKGQVLANEFKKDMGFSLDSIWGKFLRSKLSPIPSLGVDYAMDEDFKGDKFTWKSALLSRAFPMDAANIVSNAYSGGPLDALAATPGMAGVGYVYYKDAPEQPTTPAEKLAGKINSMTMPDLTKDADADAVDDRIMDLKARGRRGEDVSGEIQGLFAAGEITRRRASGLINGTDDSYFEAKVKRMPTVLLNQVRPVANAGERVLIDEIIETRRIKALMKGPPKPLPLQPKPEAYNRAGATVGQRPQ